MYVQCKPTWCHQWSEMPRLRPPAAPKQFPSHPHTRGAVWQVQGEAGAWAGWRLVYKSSQLNQFRARISFLYLFTGWRPGLIFIWLLPSYPSALISTCLSRVGQMMEQLRSQHFTWIAQIVYLVLQGLGRRGATARIWYAARDGSPRSHQFWGCCWRWFSWSINLRSCSHSDREHHADSYPLWQEGLGTTKILWNY